MGLYRIGLLNVSTTIDHIRTKIQMTSLTQQKENFIEVRLESESDNMVMDIIRNNVCSWCRAENKKEQRWLIQCVEPEYVTISCEGKYLDGSGSLIFLKERDEKNTAQQWRLFHFAG